NRKIPGTLNWIETNQGDILYQGDQILTDDRSTVLVSFDSGPELIIGPQTLIKIDLFRDNFNINIIKGSIEVKQKAKSIKKVLLSNNENEKIEIKEGSRIETSPFGLMTNQQIPKQNSTFNVIDSPTIGKIINPSTDKDIPIEFKSPQSGTIYVYNSNGVEVGQYKVQQQQSLSLPMFEPGRYFTQIKNSEGREIGKTSFTVTSYESPSINQLSSKSEYYKGEKIELSWKGREDIIYKLRIKTPTQTVIRQVRGNHYSYPLEEKGEHSFEVAIVSNNHVYKSAKQLVNVNLVAGLVIPENQLFQNVKKTENAQFTVKNHLNSDPVVFEVSPNPEFTQIIKKESSPIGKKEIAMEKPGIYYARARTESAKPIVSSVAKIVVSGPVARVAKDYQKNQIISDDKKKVLLSWNKVEGADRSILQVSETADFKELLINKETDLNKELVEIPKLGKYFWRLSPKTDSPQYLTKTAPIALEAVLPKPLTIPKIIPRQIIYYRDIKGTASYVIKFNPYPFAKKYWIEVFADKELQKLVFKKSFDNTEAYWVSNRSGLYYYKVKIEDKWGRMSQYSDVGELIFPISPLVK
ncbi:MAG: hypothetical protein CO099_02085, partial [Bdellovibrio sp. CG_4_9_14_3_um_filter_39_7]